MCDGDRFVGYLCPFILSFALGAFLLPFGATQWADDQDKVAVKMEVTGFDIRIGFGGDLIVYIHYYVTPLDTTIRMKRYVYGPSYGYEELKRKMEKKIGERSYGWWYPRYGLSWTKFGNGHGTTIAGAVFLGVSLLIGIAAGVHEWIERRRQYTQV